MWTMLDQLTALMPDWKETLVAEATRLDVPLPEEYTDESVRQLINIIEAKLKARIAVRKRFMEAILDLDGIADNLLGD